MNYVKTYLKRNKLTREQLAKMLDLSVSQIDKLAAGAAKLQKTTRLAMERLEID